MPTVSLASADFAAARSRIANRIHQTPLQHSKLIGERLGAGLWLKCENLQKTGSFKARGVLNKLTQLDAESRRRGVVTI